MNLLMKRFLQLAIIMSLLLIGAKAFAFECDGYRKDNKCYVQDWYYSFPKVQECRQETFREQDEATKSSIQAQIDEVTNQQIELQKQMDALRAKKNELLRQFVNVPVIYSRKDVCFEVEKAKFNPTKFKVLPVTGVQR